MKARILFPIIFVGMANGAGAGPIEDDAYGAFEFFCIEQIRNIGDFPRLMPPIGFEAIAPEKAAPFLSGRSGLAWIGKTPNARLMIAVTEGSACALFAPDASGPQIEEVFRKNATSVELHSEKIGTQIEKMFAVTQQDRGGGPDIHVMVMINSSALQGVTGVELTSMPSSRFPDAEKNWPPRP